MRGPKTKAAIKVTAKSTAFYSDAKTAKVEMGFGKENLDKSVVVPLSQLGGY